MAGGGIGESGNMLIQETLCDTTRDLSNSRRLQSSGPIYLNKHEMNFAQMEDHHDCRVAWGSAASSGAVRLSSDIRKYGIGRSPRVCGKGYAMIASKITDSKSGR